MMIKRLSNGPLHHFYGYYGICPWDQSGRYHLAHETDFHDRVTTPDDRAAVGLIDKADGSFQPFGSTSAFNLQQGAMMQWIDAGFGEEFTYNDWQDDRLVVRAVNRLTGEVRTIDGAIADVSPCRSRAVGLDYGRIYAMVKHYGYAHTRFVWQDIEPIPEDDGLFHIDLRTGQSELMVSIADVSRAHHVADVQREPHHLFHAVYSPDGARVVFFCRIRKPDVGGLHSLWMVNVDGSDLRCLIDYRFVPSHFAWMDERTLMIACDVLGENQFVKLDVDTGEVEPMVIDRFPADGHNTFSPDGRWLVCDTYPEGEERLCRVELYDRQTKQTHHLASLHHPERIRGGWRCDLHPRWSRDGRTITIDSVFEGSRQIYSLDVPPGSDAPGSDGGE